MSQECWCQDSQWCFAALPEDLESGTSPPKNKNPPQKNDKQDNLRFKKRHREKYLLQIYWKRCLFHLWVAVFTVGGAVSHLITGLGVEMVDQNPKLLGDFQRFVIRSCTIRHQEVHLWPLLEKKIKWLEHFSMNSPLKKQPQDYTVDMETEQVVKRWNWVQRMRTGVQWWKCLI